MASINFDVSSLNFNLSENQEQHAARDRIKEESTIAIKGPPGTGKSTVISSCCFDLIREYSPVLVVTPTNAMVDSILAKIDSLVRGANLQLPRGFIIRYGNTTELNYSFPYLNSYTLDALVLQHQVSNGGGITKIRAGIDLMQNARIILCTDYIAKDLKNIIHAGAVLIDEAGLVSLDKMGTIFSSLRDNNGKVIVIGDDKQLPPPSNDYVATSLFRSILQYFKSTLLRKEYRFNKDILELINHYYDNQLVADYSVSDISTADIAKKNYSGVNDNLRKILQHDKKTVFVDTDDKRREDRHFVNTGEVSIIKDIIEGCQSMGIDSIMVITPYKQQERMLQLHLQHHHYHHQPNMQGIRIGTVDKFQGQEAQVAIISMVRSNTKQDYHEAIGFVNNSRACVAFSRSKRKTIIVGDQTTLIRNKFLATSIDTITRKDGFFIWRDSLS
jgi:superfamily I DNA and/or RNA helicase